jgi:hypothetical protein
VPEENWKKGMGVLVPGHAADLEGTLCGGGAARLGHGEAAESAGSCGRLSGRGGGSGGGGSC